MNVRYVRALFVLAALAPVLLVVIPGLSRPYVIELQPDGRIRIQDQRRHIDWQTADTTVCSAREGIMKRPSGYGLPSDLELTQWDSLLAEIAQRDHRDIICEAHFVLGRPFAENSEDPTGDWANVVWVKRDP